MKTTRRRTMFHRNHRNQFRHYFAATTIS